MAVVRLKVLLDTSGYSALQRGDQRVLGVMQNAETIAVPVVVLGEVQSGFRAGNRQTENEKTLARFLEKRSVCILGITEETALRYAEIDVFLRRKGHPIPRNDIWIAALALEHGLQLLTLDAHFCTIPMLLIEPRENE